MNQTFNRIKDEMVAQDSFGGHWQAKKGTTHLTRIREVMLLHKKHSNIPRQILFLATSFSLRTYNLGLAASTWKNPKRMRRPGDGLRSFLGELVREPNSPRTLVEAGKLTGTRRTRINHPHPQSTGQGDEYDKNEDHVPSGATTVLQSREKKSAFHTLESVFWKLSSAGENLMGMLKNIFEKLPEEKITN